MKKMREIVERGYDEGDYAGTYRLRDDINRYPFEKKNLDRMIELLPRGAEILDLGCGPGIPMDSYLVEMGFRVTGVDICRKHIEMARSHVPEAKFIKDDMTSAEFGDSAFDAIFSLYTIFHIPREEHEELLQKMCRMLKPNGLTLVTMGTDTEDESNVGEFIGSQMAWSSYPMDENLRLVENCGFEILHWEEEGKEGYPEHHLWILARKKH